MRRPISAHLHSYWAANQKAHLRSIKGTSAAAAADINGVTVPNNLAEKFEQKDGVASTLLVIRNEAASAREGYRRHIGRWLVGIYAAASYLRDDSDAWLDFCGYPDWDQMRRGRPRQAHPEDSLRAAVRFAVGFGSKSITKRVSKYTNVLQPYFQRAVKPGEVSEIVAEGGIKALAKQSRALGACDHISRVSPSVQKRVSLDMGKSAKAIFEAPAGSRFSIECKSINREDGSKTLVVINSVKLR